MSKHLLVFLLSEIDTVRVICKHPNCGGIVELPIDKLAVNRDSKCRLCGADFDPNGSGYGELAAFAQAVQKMKMLRKFVDLEFVLPASSSSSS